MEQNNTNTIQTPDYYRELGKTKLKSKDPTQRSEGISDILKAYSSGDPEATYLVGHLMLHGF